MIRSVPSEYRNRQLKADHYSVLKLRNPMNVVGITPEAVPRTFGRCHGKKRGLFLMEGTAAIIDLACFVPLRAPLLDDGY
jgi:hypothetical protein